jgi:DNA (cytosine-5)-methyltransferase 1
MDDVETRIIRTGSQWGKYEPAIRRWENLTRPVPPPTEPNTKGNPRLAPAFPEWMMGLPADWVTGVPGISRNDQLRIIGNGVVPQQAIAALTWLLGIEQAA